MNVTSAYPLLSENDPAPVEWVNQSSETPVLLLCEHAGQSIPESLGDLGLAPGVIDTHIGLDIGAEALARAVAERLNCPLVLQRYSRLVIDCNRPPGTPGSIPSVSDGVGIPGNIGLSQADAERRVTEIFAPLNAAIRSGFERAPRRAGFSIHSYVPALLNGRQRPWHAGFLTRCDLTTASLMLDTIAARDPNLVLAVNEPYKICDDSDWFIPQFPEEYEIEHALIEVRHDLLKDRDGVEIWADHLSHAILKILECEP
ncbi:N-formylglutamate amidohydrolase [Leisingera thetidis]|uniref:N-formylglutamate amidohydrolase n=1 Tax=Leisingera thetidis TaxID=2930199 RepID=UPI0021F7811A|nr:N-formylglutamate amidohydrolase [Leisingera thetidis]